jgi:hypothetical protein
MQGHGAFISYMSRVALAPGLLLGCGSGTTVDASYDASAENASATESDGASHEAPLEATSESQEPVHSDVSVEPQGTCPEGMQCHAAGDCSCVMGHWKCVDDPQLLADVSLPSSEPQRGAPCHGVNMACTMPNRCGSLCACSNGHWNCASLPVDGTPAQVVQQNFDGGLAPAGSVAMCPWETSELICGPDSVGAKVFTIACNSSWCECPNPPDGSTAWNWKCMLWFSPDNCDNNPGH